MRGRLLLFNLFLTLGYLYGGDLPVEIPGYPKNNLIGTVYQITDFTGSSLEDLEIKGIKTLNERGMIDSEKFYTRQGTVSAVITYYYDTAGRLIEIVGKNPAEIGSWRYEFRYNEKGKLVEELAWSRSRELEGRNLFNYSSKGLLSEKIMYSADNYETIRELYRYDDEGRLSSWLILFPDGKLLKRVDFVYNDIGLVSEELYHNESTYYKKKKYFYNKNLLWERVQIDDFQGENCETTLYFYNGDGKLVEEITRDAKGQIKVYNVITYDHMGNEFSRLDSRGVYSLREIQY
ncbi:MAG: hypothetical protein J6K76_05925 [Spirochaetaceae bacterium]|nr:hypothetical protein [Spirochaetaceae bacterium]